MKDGKLKKFKDIRVIVEEEIEIKGSIHYENVKCFLSEIRKELEKNNINAEFRKTKALNHHMNLQFWSDDSKMIKGRAIYFFREGKSSSLAPFYITNSEDITVLKNFFEKLWKVSKVLFRTSRRTRH